MSTIIDLVNTDNGATSMATINTNFDTLNTDKVEGSGTANELAYFTAEKTIDNLAVATYPSLTEVSYVKGVTSAIQTQINGKQTSGSYEVTTNKENTTLDTSTSKYPTNRLTKEYADTKLPLAGGTMTGDITLGENTSIALDPAGSADGKYTGITITGTAGATLAFGDLIYLAAATSKWVLTDADASSTGGPVMIGMCVLAANDTQSTKILLQGQIRADAKFPALTVGGSVYLGETAGAIQTAIPTGADNVIRVVGFALTADEIYFNPSQDHQLSVA